jgi:hypothetical protein
LTDPADKECWTCQADKEYRTKKSDKADADLAAKADQTDTSVSDWADRVVTNRADMTAQADAGLEDKVDRAGRTLNMSTGLGIRCATSDRQSPSLSKNLSSKIYR